jgi:hypothetical protein
MMKTRSIFLLVCLLLFVNIAIMAGTSPWFYELRTYRFKTSEQEQRTEQYLQKALLPALHRANIKTVGVFKPVETDTTYGKLIVVLIPYRSLDQFEKMSSVLDKDKQYQNDGREYIDAPYNNPPYARVERILLKAFSGMPEIGVPKFSTPASERVYELRSYEGHTEKIYRNKVRMFNEGDEVGLFKRLGFNAVFYGEVLVGSEMPNLMYMTTFETQASRDEHWKAFGNDPQWKKLSGMPEYQNNVSKIVIRFFRPVSYSDI